MAKMKTLVERSYKAEKQDDGTFTIPGVELFGMGEHKDFDFNQDWADKALKKFRKLKKGGYLSPVYIGHDLWGAEPEIPALGFLDNLKLDEEIFYADWTKLHEDTVNDIKMGKWPSRSADVGTKDPRIIGVALLGRSEPYFNFPQMHTLQFKVEEDEHIYRMVWPPMPDVQKAFTNVRHMTIEPEKQDDIKDKQEDEAMDDKKFTQEDLDAKIKETKELTEQETAAKFQEEFGMTPEAMKKQLDAAEDKSTKLAADNRAADIKAFTEKLTATRIKCSDGEERALAPGLIKMYSQIRPLLPDGGDEKDVIQFSENGDKYAAGPALDRFMEETIKLCEASLFSIPIGDKVAGKDGEDNDGLDSGDDTDTGTVKGGFANRAEDAQFDKKVQKHMKQARKDGRKLSYIEAQAELKDLQE